MSEPMEDEERQGTWRDKHGDRHYRDPLNETQTWTGVSAILAAKAKPFLEVAKLKAQAAYAAKHRKRLATVTRAPLVVGELLDERLTLPEWDRKRNEGSQAAQIMDDLANERPLTVPMTHDRLDAKSPLNWVPRWWADFLEETGFTVVDTERTVINDEFGYGGSYDVFGHLRDGKPVYVDAKTNFWGPNPDVALQCEFYRRAKFILDTETGERSPAHQAVESWVLWMRPEGWAFRPLLSGPEVWRHCFARMMTYHGLSAEQAIGDREYGELDPPSRFW